MLRRGDYNITHSQIVNLIKRRLGPVGFRAPTEQESNAFIKISEEISARPNRTDIKAVAIWPYAEGLARDFKNTDRINVNGLHLQVDNRTSDKTLNAHANLGLFVYQKCIEYEDTKGISLERVSYHVHTLMENDRFGKDRKIILYPNITRTSLLTIEFCDDAQHTNLGKTIYVFEPKAYIRICDARLNRVVRAYKLYDKFPSVSTMKKLGTTGIDQEDKDIIKSILGSS